MYEQWHDLIWRAVHTAWETFLAAWPAGAVLTDLSAWKLAGAAALTAGIAMVLSGLKTWIITRRQ